MPSRDLRSRWSRSLLTVPTALLVLIVVLGLFKVSGSSIALHDESDPSAELIGQPRPVRSDELFTRTPMVVRQAALDFPAETDMGVGVHDTGVLSDLPVKSIASIVKPHAWAYFVVGVDRAFAFEWWIVVTGPFLGVYVVLALLTRNRLISSLAGLIAAAAPAAAWWAIPSMGLSVLYGGISAALLIAALRRGGRKRLLYAIAAGWSAAAFVSLLYVPWIVPLAIIFGAIVLTQVPGVFRGWRQVASFVGAFGGVFAVLMAVFYAQHHAALRAIAESVYPGKRVTLGGEAKPVLMFGAPYDVLGTSRQLATVDGTNQSEAASGLMLWLPIAIAGGAFALRSRIAATRALAAVMTVSVVLAAWAFLPIPASLGQFLVLTRVQGSRLAFPLSVAGALAAGLYVHRVRTDGTFRPGRDRMVAATLTFAFITGWAGTQVSIDGIAPSRRSIMLLLVAVTLATLAIMFGKVLLGLGGAAALLLFGSVRVNPIQIGLDPVTQDPLIHQIDAVRATDGATASARWAALGLSFHTKSILSASGAPTATGISWYADRAVWTAIDPGAVQQGLWDRFALVAIDVDDTLSTPQLELAQPDYIIVHTPLCGGALQALQVRYVIVDQAIESGCLRGVTEPATTGERWIYEVVDPAA